jgi:hypothetical protein
MELHLKIIGVLLVGLALMHAFFPKHFRWKEELAGLSLFSRQVMYVHTLFIGLMILLMGLLCLFSSSELVGTALGKRVCLGMAIFWVTRLLVQLFVYSSELWRGKVFETIIHIVFSLLWIYLSVVFTIAWLT